VPAGIGTELATIAKSEIAATADLVAKTPAFQKVLRPMATVVNNTRSMITIAVEHGLTEIRTIAELVSERIALEGVVVDAGAFLRHNLAGAQELQLFLKSSAKVYGSAATRGIKGFIRRRQLPTTGKIRFVPPKNFNPSIDLSSVKKGFVDKFGNVWQKGPSRTLGEPFEWDVQLSSKGKSMLGWLSKSGKHINVSLKGRITHK